MSTRKKTETHASRNLEAVSRRKPFLLLHICCGPCSTHVIEVLNKVYHPIGFFYNPNLYPKEEYYRRLKAAAKVAESLRTALWVPPAEHEAWMEIMVGMEGDPEGGRRCNICIRHRLEKAACMAKTASIDTFATTLSIGPSKNSRKINEIGVDLSKRYELSFLEADFKKRDGFLKSVQISKALGLYRQDYCGCCFSMRGN
jgi:hypothetical protein